MKANIPKDEKIVPIQSTNKEEKKVYGIRDGIKLMMPYCLVLSLTWILIVVLWYIIGLPLGPSVFPTL